ncbi:MAG: RNase P modulator RnpM [Lachnospiraceae bacterium]
MKTKNKIPMRQCVGCRQMKPKKELLRVVRTPQQEIVLDSTGKINGRGAYLCPSVECFEKARKSKGLERSLETAIPEEVYDKLKKEFEAIE